jgi:general secretion pathway protein G
MFQVLRSIPNFSSQPQLVMKPTPLDRTQRRPNVHFCSDLKHNSSRRTVRRSPSSGFSLVELIVVMVIIGLLSSLVAIRTRAYLISAKQNAAKAEISTVVRALETFYATESRYPTNEEGVEILAERRESFGDALLTKVPIDPWGNVYQYVSPGTDNPYEVLSLGADGKEGGEGADADISSEELDANQR